MKSTSAMRAMFAAMFGAVASPFGHVERMPAQRYPIASDKYAVGQRHNPAGSKLARKAAERRLTGNRMSHYGQGLLNAFAAKRGVRA